MIQQLLEQLTRTGVKDISFDTRRETIRIQLKDESSVQFEEVVSFFFTDDFPAVHEGEGLTPIVYDAMGLMPVMDLTEEDEEFLESLEAIGLTSQPFDEELFDDFPSISYPNFSVSLGHTSLLIEAKKVRIGDQLYHLSALLH